VDSPYREPAAAISGTISPIREQVYICPPGEGGYHPSGNGKVLIAGFPISNPGKSYSPEEMNDEYFHHSAGEMQGENSVMNVKIDNNEYLINGNPARHMTYDSRDGQNTYEYFQVVHDSTFSTLERAGSKSYVSTAATVMRTFAPYQETRVRNAGIGWNQISRLISVF
jgi:hypothetical protein